MSDVDYNEYLKSEQWRKLVNQRLKIDHYTCVMCGSHGSPNNPLECHHFSYKNIGREDVWKELVIVCDNCHLLVTRLMNRVIDENGTRGWSGKQIPRITTYTLNGYHQLHRKENLENAKGNTKEI